MKKKVLITGITGQDGPYMAELCLNWGHEVYGMVRRTAQIHDKNFRHLTMNPNFKIVRGDLLDAVSINTLVQDIKPDYFINFAAQSFVGDSWKIPEETFVVTAVGVLRCLEAIRKYHPSCRFYNAGSSEQFGDVICTPQNETHPFRPRSPYGAAKCAAMHLVKVYRESYELYAIQGMLFNHESERRGEEFVTRKITKGLARIAKAIQNGHKFESIHLGNLSACRDWSHASDFVDAIWRMLNQEQFNIDIWQSVCDLPKEQWTKILSANIKEYVVASGETHTIRDFITSCIVHLQNVGVMPPCQWSGADMDEKLLIDDTYAKEHNLSREIVTIDSTFYRPADVHLLLGDPSLIRKDLGWKQKISFDTLTKRMVDSDLYEAGVLTNTTTNAARSPAESQTETKSTQTS